MRGRKLSWLPAGAGLAGLGLALGLAAVASQGLGASSPDLAAPDTEAPFANRPPLVGVRGGTVRAGETLVLAAYASDMESAAVHLEVSLDLQPGQRAPSWLGQSVWTADLAAQPILRIPLSPPADAEPGAYSLLVGATDSGGLTSWRRMTLEVLPPADPQPSASTRPVGANGAPTSASASSGGAAPKSASSKASPAASSTADSPSLSLSVSPSSMAEGRSGDIVVSATLLGASMVPGMDVSAELQVSGTATDGEDYTLSGTKSVTIPANSSTLTGTRTLRLSALADDLRREDDETVRLRVSQVTRGTEVLPLSAMAEAQVMVENVFEKPPEVSGVSAEAGRCGESTCALRVSWDAPPASPPLTEQFVQHRREDKPNGWARTDVPSAATGVLLTGLQPGRRYVVRVRARNRVGRSEWSAAAAANTAPLVTASAANGGVAFLDAGGARALIPLTGAAQARGGGTLTGRWFRIYPNPNHQQSEIKLSAGGRFAMESGRDHRKASSPGSDRPEARFYRLEVTHELSGQATVASAQVALVWLPKVVLGASPSSVAEDGGGRAVRVEARLTGKSVSPLPKSVAVSVRGGTATAGTDFAAVPGFTIRIPGGVRSASGTFTLRPTADSAAEGGETVRVEGSAKDGPHDLEVLGATVTIDDEEVALSVSPTPANGSVTGPGIDCGTGTSGDCSETVTKSSEVPLTAEPAAGYVFDEWSGACSSEDGDSCTVAVPGATTVGASFRLPKLTVRVLPASGGSVTGSGIDCGAGTTDDCEESVSGGSIELTATPASGHGVRFWSGGGCSGTGRTCTASVTADGTVTVAFVEQPAPSAPSGLSASPGDGQVALSWTDPGNATISGYELRYKVGSGAYGSWADISGSGAATTAHTVTGLTNGTAHTFQLRAENSTGAGAAATVSATPDAIPGPVTGVTATATGADAASLTWTAPTTGGAVVSYEVSGSGTIAVSGTSATVTGLSQATDYKWTVQAVNASGSSEATESNGIRIPHLPGLVTNLSAVAASGSSATLTWTAPAVTAAEGEAASYAVSGDGTIVVSGTTAAITGLSKNTDYSWSVAAVNVSGTGAAKASDSIRIPHAPGPVTGLSAVAEGNSKAKLTWTEPAATATAGAASSYAVSGDGTIVVSGTSAVVTGLTAGSTYTWTVAAVNVSGTSSTASVSLTMPNAATLTVSGSPSAGGSVTGSESGATSRIIDCGTDCTETVDSGTVVNLTATPTAHYVVKSWSGGGCSGTGTTCQVTVSANTTVSVTFGKPTLGVSPKPANGYVTGNGLSCGSGTGRTTCSVTLNRGTAVSLSATADSGYDFGRWSGGCSGTSSSCAFSLTGDTTVGAGFVTEPTYETDTIYLLASTKPAKPAGGVYRYLYRPPDGWTRTLPTVSLDKQVYRSQRTSTYVNGAFVSATDWSDVDKYRYWSRKTEYVYKRASAKPNAPSGGTRTMDHRPSGWSTSSLGPTLAEPEWRAQRTVTLNHTLRLGGSYVDGLDSATVWSGVVRYSYLTQELKSFYKRAATKPSPPTGDPPSGWKTAPPEPTLTEPVWRVQWTVTFKHELQDNDGFLKQVISATPRVVEKYWHLTQKQDYVYKKSASSPPTPTGGTNTEEHTPSGWQRVKPTPTTAQSVWRAGRTLIFKHTLGSSEGVFYSAKAWGGVTEYCRAELDGYIYKLAASKPSAPSGGAKDETHTPAGWSRTQPTPTATDHAYRAERILHYKDGSFDKAEKWTGVTKVASALSVDPGGPYTARFFDAVSGGVFASPRFWTAEVTASASGGAGSYTFRWQDKSKDGNPTTYVLFEERTHTRSVTVTDANGNQRTSNPPAEIVCSASGGAGGASDGERGSIPVPLGGTLDLVWGNGGLTSASSKDAGVATASVVSGHELTVTGVSVGETDIVVQAGGVEYWLPVRVEDG